MHSPKYYSLSLSFLFPLAYAQAPVSSNGLRYCTSYPLAWGDGSPTCVSGVSSFSDADYSGVMNGFNSEYCNGDWTGDISVESAAFSEDGLTFSVTNLPTEPDNYPYGTTARRPIECDRIKNFFFSAQGNLIGCGDLISYSCDYSPPDLYEDTPWQYTMSLYVNSDLYWVLANRNGVAPPSGAPKSYKGSTTGIKARPQALAPEGTYYIDIGGATGISLTNDPNGFTLI